MHPNEYSRDKEHVQLVPHPPASKDRFGTRIEGHPLIPMGESRKLQQIYIEVI